MWSSSHWSDSDASSDSSIQSWDNGGLNSIDECDIKPDIYYTLGSCSPLSTISSPSPSPSPVQDLSTSTPKSERKPRTSGCNKMCFHCHATSTPLWRREPSTLRTLCNACGLYLQQRNKLRPQELIDADNDDESENSEQDGTDGPECSHCHTRNTSVWRRSKTGAQLCNACGVYARLRGKERPLSLKRNKIKPRTKHAKTPTD
ncbi:hypothetical protein BDP27DRAFT_1311931 [Rhodocollybia butyracea]|uniref:GATA-type domain-containing protein n=1 Tax=Rhodocollybia butyracea TaxID=206335 RepID=A0A9P5Q9H8_9AGAR|nr:hypothetical protein BDP27DRAFT_1311931 [Rhodocollybia butyracea]